MICPAKAGTPLAPGIDNETISHYQFNVSTGHIELTGTPIVPQVIDLKYGLVQRPSMLDVQVETDLVAAMEELRIRPRTVSTLTLPQRTRSSLNLAY